MSYAVGIDLGTTNSVVSVYRRGQIETLLVDGNNFIPSVVSFKDENTMLVGHTAKARLLMDPEHSVGSAKRFMGDPTQKYHIYEKFYTPVDISAFVLRKLADGASQVLGEKVLDAVITVPAYFNNNQKSDTKKAGEQAGLNVLRLIPEPTAAAISYGLDKGKDQTIMVYDLGGGTFDVSILKVEGNTFRVIAVDGDFHLGGDDFDNEVVNYLLAIIKQQSGKDLSRDTERAGLLAKQKLKEAAEKAKIELSQSLSTEIIIPDIAGIHLETELTLEQYNALIKPLVDKTVDKIKHVLSEAKLTAEDIDRVILVGGSTRNQLVKEVIANTIKEPYISEKVDEVVSNGAAVLAAHLTLPETDFIPIEVTNVTAYNLGLRYSKGKDTDLFRKIIAKNTEIPVEMPGEFTTFKNNQKSVEIAVFQGESDKCSQNTFIGGFILSGIPLALAGKPTIKVNFRMDESDILNVTATCDNISGNIRLDVNSVSEEKSGVGEPEIIFLLIDVSGSMEGAPLEITKQAVRAFLQVKTDARHKDLVGCISFGSSANLVISPMADYKQVNTRIQALSVSGSTNMAAGINLAISSLKGSWLEKAFTNRSDYQKRIILLSDGYPDSKKAVQNSYRDLVNNSIGVDAVGAGGGYDRNLMQEIADKTGGVFVPADNIADLIRVFTNLAEKSTGDIFKTSADN